MTYQPIQNYGLIGNMRTAALVSMHGSIDWFCFPRFDSPSVFGAILDDEKGGRFSIAPLNHGVTYKQMYWPDTNILVTRFLCEDAVGEIIDFMPIGQSLAEDAHHQLVRRVSVIRGKMKFRVTCRPAFNYALDTHTVELDKHGVLFHSETMTLRLTAERELQVDGDAAVCDVELKDGEEAVFALRSSEFPPGAQDWLTRDDADRLFNETVHYWRDWLAQCTYTGRWREIVHRSALALKLLTYQPTGAIIAAPTTGLPENVGGASNWDYRFTWIRDAAFTIYAFMRIGFTEEAAGFMHWLEARCHEREPDGSLHVMFSVTGEHELTEYTLDHLEGYRQSRPVRIGNAAYDQVQLDIYGELMDSVYLFNKYGTPISYELWVELRELLDWLADHWDRKDHGVWEFRAEPQYYVYSRLMCWVAFDRGLRLAEKRSFPAPRDRWMATRNAIYEEIMNKGYNKEVDAFVQFYGSDLLDASVLIMPMVFFISPTDPLFLSTLEAINRPPDEGGLVSDSLVYRYYYDALGDGRTGTEVEGTFNMCSFWLIEALTRAGRLEEARLKFERMLSYANHLGLYSEETGKAGEALGNFPQGLTHLALISAAFNLDRALGEIE